MHNLTVTVQSGQKYHTFIAVFAALPAVPNQYGVKKQETVYHLIGSWYWFDSLTIGQISYFGVGLMTFD